VVVSSFVVPGGVCIGIVWVVFSVFSHSACFGGMVAHFAACAVVLLVSVSSSTFTSATSPTMAMGTATTKISTSGV